MKNICGIIGYTGRRLAAPLLLEGLRRLGYRGYDSAGVAVADGWRLRVAKRTGGVERLRGAARLPGGTGIGHTRWATHGDASEANAHPHQDCTGGIALVHNGVIDNADALRRDLQAQGHVFRSGTDTEILPHLVEHFYEGDLEAATRRALALVEGSYAIALLSRHEPGTLVVARRRMPLWIGAAPEGHACASDPQAFDARVREAFPLEEGEVATLRPDGLLVRDAQGLPRAPRFEPLPPRAPSPERREGAHMRAEIGETPGSLRRLLDARLDPAAPLLDAGDAALARRLADARRVLLLGCGTSLHAAQVGKHVLERVAGLPTEVQPAGEYRYAEPFAEPGTLAVCISQSGETADTLEAARRARALGQPVVALVNVAHSSLAREADGAILLRAGVETSVAATKSFVHTLAALHALALRLGQARGRIADAEARERRAQLRRVPGALARVLEGEDALRAFARRRLAPARAAFFLGRGPSHGLALEGALKLKEVAYVHAQGYSAAELKHGPLALVEPGLPVVACVTREATRAASLANLSEVQARGAHILALVDETDADAAARADDAFALPELDPLLQTMPAATALHLMAYHAARALGRDVDHPRNLAKSVTVE